MYYLVVSTVGGWGGYFSLDWNAHCRVLFYDISAAVVPVEAYASSSLALMHPFSSAFTRPSQPLFLTYCFIHPFLCRQQGLLMIVSRPLAEVGHFALLWLSFTLLTEAGIFICIY